MVHTLNTILLTSTELFQLRNQLKDLKTPESRNLFCCLYRSWCHNPVTTVSLCFLTQNYRHAYDLIQKLYPSLTILPPSLRRLRPVLEDSPPRLPSGPVALRPVRPSEGRS